MMDICLLKMEPTFHKYKGRAVFRGDIVKDDSGSYAVFTEQGSSVDVIAADAVSAYTQVKMECPDIWIRLPRPLYF